MKKIFKKTKGLIRGTSTAVLLSVVIHAVIFFAAGVWVVFQIIDAQETKFVPPPPIERPKMQLKKLRVKVKPSAKPRKTTQRITSARKTAAMPDIQLPEMTGMGAGLEGGVGGFEMMADVASMTIMGAGKSVGNDLEGTFYDLKRHRDGTPVTGMSPGTTTTPPYRDALNRFLANDWSPRTFSDFFKAPRKLYATQFMIPPCPSSIAPKKFGIEENDFVAALWVIHYQGKIAHKTGGKFRFWGYGDDVLWVRLNDKIALNASTFYRDDIHDPEDWKSSSKLNRKKIVGMSHARVGDWFTLEPGVPVDMDVLMGEVPGGWFQMTLLVEEFGVDYPENDQGYPILPIFKTMKTPPHLIDEIEYTLTPGEIDLEGGPIFGVY